MGSDSQSQEPRTHGSRARSKRKDEPLTACAALRLRQLARAARVRLMATVRIKICGITNVNDGRRAAFLGADAVGLNFYTQSPRCIDFAEAHAIMRALPPFVEPVGLFVNESLTNVFKKLNQLGRIRLIQWH